MKRIVITLLVAAILGGIAAYWWLLREPGPANVWELQVYGDDDKYAKVSTFRDVSTSLGDAQIALEIDCYEDYYMIG